MATDLLHAAFFARAETDPSATAAVCDDLHVDYGELAGAAHRLAAQLHALGLQPQDRVGLLLPKSLDALVATFAVLEAGGTYVPLCDQSPPSRQRTVLEDCAVRGLIATGAELAKLAEFDAKYLASLDFVLSREPPRLGCRGATWAPGRQAHAPSGLSSIAADAPAYILYTSGSTGQPKGVVVSHRGAKSFVQWAVRTFQISEADRLTNHAQLSFDLSVLDIFAALSTGAQVHLLTPSWLAFPERICQLLQTRRITLWYSVPSALTMLCREGGLESVGPASLKRVLFAGEVFPIPRLREAMQALPQARFFNLFGPTETNVCTWYALPQSVPANAATIPIGRVCEHLQASVRAESGQLAASGEAGELCVAGPAVMRCYFGREDATRAAFWPAASEAGPSWYRTGDLVRQDQAGLFWFLGRRDRQIKHRGYRIELGALEAALARLPGVVEAAAVVAPDPERGSRLHAVVVGAPEATLSVLTVKLHCGSLLPRYMVPDSVEFRSRLPRTTTGKVDTRNLL